MTLFLLLCQCHGNKSWYDITQVSCQVLAPDPTHLLIQRSCLSLLKCSDKEERKHILSVHINPSLVKFMVMVSTFVWATVSNIQYPKKLARVNAETPLPFVPKWSSTVSRVIATYHRLISPLAWFIGSTLWPPHTVQAMGSPVPCILVSNGGDWLKSLGPRAA